MRWLLMLVLVVGCGKSSVTPQVTKAKTVYTVSFLYGDQAGTCTQEAKISDLDSLVANYHGLVFPPEDGVSSPTKCHISQPDANNWISVSCDSRCVRSGLCDPPPHAGLSCSWSPPYALN